MFRGFVSYQMTQENYATLASDTTDFASALNCKLDIGY